MYYRYLERELAPGRLVVQPRNRGTGPGILYPLLRLAALAGDVPVAIFPSDHYVSSDAAFVAHVRTALAACVIRRNRIILLGIEPSSPERDYGWIETETAHLPLPDDAGPVERVRRFCEKPSATEADDLMRRGALWNSFVMAGRVGTFLELIATSVPALARAFETVRRTLASHREAAAIARLYERLPVISFAAAILAPSPERLGALRVRDVEWSDWGSPERVRDTLLRTGSMPRWLADITPSPARPTAAALSDSPGVEDRPRNVSLG
jgi:mannose-1-phosphate guanylyltransferase